jgi:hypothetical protein
VAQFITYRSQQEASNSLRTNLLSGPLPRCFGQGEVVPLDKDMHQTAPMVWQRCAIFLDDPVSGDRAGMHSRLGDFVFKECLVIYKGGPIDGFVTYALFQDCIFSFSTDRAPSRRGEMISQFLLKTLPSSSIHLPPNRRFSANWARPTIAICNQRSFRPYRPAGRHENAIQ